MRRQSHQGEEEDEEEEETVRKGETEEKAENALVLQMCKRMESYLVLMTSCNIVHLCI